MPVEAVLYVSTGAYDLVGAGSKSGLEVSGSQIAFSLVQEGKKVPVHDLTEPIELTAPVGDEDDLVSAIAQYQIFFVLVAALMSMVSSPEYVSDDADPGDAYSQSRFGWLLVVASIIGPGIAFAMVLREKAADLREIYRSCIGERTGDGGEERTGTDTANPVHGEATGGGIEMMGAQPTRATPTRTGASVAPVADEGAESFNLADVYSTHARGSHVGGTNPSIRVPAKSM